MTELYVMMSSAVSRDKATIALFQRLCREKAQQNAVLNCPYCRSKLSCIYLETDDEGYQMIWWLCSRNIKFKTCHFPMDLPQEPFRFKRSPSDVQQGITPHPRMELLPEFYRYLYPDLFAYSAAASSAVRSGPVLRNGMSLESKVESADKSGGSDGASGGVSLYTRDMSLSSVLPSPGYSCSPLPDEVVPRPSPLTVECGTIQRSLHPSIEPAASGNATAESLPTSALSASSRDSHVNPHANHVNTSQASHVGVTLSITPPMIMAECEPSTSSGNTGSDSSGVKKRVVWCTERYATTLQQQEDARLGDLRRRMNQLYARLARLDRDKMEEGEYEARVENIADELKGIQKESGLAPNRQSRSSYSRVVSSYEKVDTSQFRQKVKRKSKIEHLEMLRSLREAKDADDVMTAVGADRVVKVAKNEDVLLANVDRRIERMVKEVSERKRQCRVAAEKILNGSRRRQSGHPDGQSPAKVGRQMTEAERKEAEEERTRSMKKEIQKKTIALVMSKYHDILARKRPAVAPSTADNSPATSVHVPVNEHGWTDHVNTHVDHVNHVNSHVSHMTEQQEQSLEDTCLDFEDMDPYLLH